jgi:hypothetical protein
MKSPGGRMHTGQNALLQAHSSLRGVTLNEAHPENGVRMYLCSLSARTQIGVKNAQNRCRTREEHSGWTRKNVQAEV